MHNIYIFQTLDKRKRLENHFLSGDNYWLRFHKSVISLLYRSSLSHALPTLPHFLKKIARNCTCRKDLMLWYNYFEPYILTMELSLSGCTFFCMSASLFARILYRHLFSWFDTTDIVITCFPFSCSFIFNKIFNPHSHQSLNKVKIFCFIIAAYWLLVTNANYQNGWRSLFGILCENVRSNFLCLFFV